MPPFGDPIRSLGTGETFKGGLQGRPQRLGGPRPLGYHNHCMDLRSAIKQHAVEIGFEFVGIAPATPGRDLEFAREWLERGYGGEMHYLANPKRFDPRSALTSVKSVVCVGLIYDTPFPYSTKVRIEGSKQKAVGSESLPVVPEHSPSGRSCPSADAQARGDDDPVSSFEFPVSSAAQPRAWISRYAWGRDYHEILREKLERLRTAIGELAPGAETRVFVDTGPVVERAFARFSGIGWMGKNTCIINEERGSWFFLGVILTNLALEPDLPAPDRCGTCRACLDACPTGALVEPYVMDATRCISYLTIELKGSIPLELRRGVGVNIFGCDICQDVCPWNRKDRSQESEVRSQETAFRPMVVDARAIESRFLPMNEGQRTNDERQRSEHSTVSSQQSDSGDVSPIQNPKSQIHNPQPSTQHPAPGTFSLFAPALEALASMTEEGFRQTFRHSPIKRTKYRGWLRNLCVAMGNSGEVRLVPKLKELAAHTDPIVREHAEWALSRLRKA